MSPKVRLTYDDSPPHARKHRWEQPAAGFSRDEDGKLVGKCSSDIDKPTAQALLENGIPWRARHSRGQYPDRVFNVFKGIPYRAHPRAPRKYHGFPELPSRIPGGPDGDIAQELKRRARREGFEEQFDTWIARWKDEP